MAPLCRGFEFERTRAKVLAEDLEGRDAGGWEAFAYLEPHAHQRLRWCFGCEVEGADGVEEVDVGLAAACGVGSGGLSYVFYREIEGVVGHGCCCNAGML